MKKIILAVSLLATVLSIVGCSTCGCPCPQPQPTPCPCHHDYKGEVSK